MAAKIAKFKDSFVILTDSPIYNNNSIYLEHFDLLSQNPLLEFNCNKNLIEDVKHNRSLLKSMIDVYMVKEITIQELKNINLKK